jgi:uncharacterized protein (DUF1778 family)
MSTITIRLNDQDDKLIRDYAKIHGKNVSESIRAAILEKIEDEFDLKAFEKAMVEYQTNPVVYSHEDVLRELGIE